MSPFASARNRRRWVAGNRSGSGTGNRARSRRRTEAGKWKSKPYPRGQRRPPWRLERSPLPAHAPGPVSAPPGQGGYCAGTRLGDRKRKACRFQWTAQWAVAMRVLEEPGSQPTATPCGCVKPALETGNFWETRGSAPKRGLGVGLWPDCREELKMRELEPKCVILLIAKLRITCTSDHVILLWPAEWCHLLVCSW